MAIGSAFPIPDEPHAEIRGRDLVSGLPKTIVVSSEEIEKAIEGLRAIVDAVKTTLDDTRRRRRASHGHRGIVVTGGGALLKDWTNACGTRPACRSTSRNARSTRSRWAPASASRTSRRCSRC